AQWEIRKSEGTRAGTTLARWGLWMSVVAGLGYFAYDKATELALTQQANNFLLVEGKDSGFFPRLLKAGADQPDDNEAAVNLNAAFLLTRPASHRVGAQPSDLEGMAKQFSAEDIRRFRANKLVRYLLQGGKKDTKIEPLG